jgi:hypothetical protein
MPMVLSKVRWNLADVHEILGFKQYGHVGKWIYRRWQSWENLFNTRHIPGSLLRSRAYSPTTIDAAEDTLSPWPRVLPFASIDTIGLIGMLATAGLCSVQHGGLRHDADAAACREVLKGLVDAISSGWDLKLIFDDVKFRWPAMPEGNGFVKVYVNPSGMVDLTDIYSAARDLQLRGRNIVAKLDLQHARTESVFDFLKRVAERSFVLFVQVVWRIGLQLDSECCQLASTGPLNVTEAKLWVTNDGMGIDTASKTEVQQYLHDYLATARRVTSGISQVSVAADKSRVFGKATFSGAVFLSNNTAAWMCPKVGLNSQNFTSVGGVDFFFRFPFLNDCFLGPHRSELRF